MRIVNSSYTYGLDIFLSQIYRHYSGYRKLLECLFGSFMKKYIYRSIVCLGIFFKRHQLYWMLIRVQMIELYIQCW